LITLKVRAGRPMSNRLDIYLLGGLRVLVDGKEIPRFRSRKSAAVLAYLAYHNHFATAREVLVEMFWPDSAPEDARNSLNTTISSLRRQLGEYSPLPESFLISERHTVQLAPGLLWTDVNAFRRAVRLGTAPGPAQATSVTEALTLYQGDLLAGFYDPWIAAEASALEHLRDSLDAIPDSSSLGGSADLPGDTWAGSGNLPRIANAFVARDRELEELVGLTERFPLVSIVGFGGIGKTRLAVEFGRGRQEEGREVWFISFAASPSTISIVDELARQMGILPSQSVEPLEQLALRFQGKPATVILDNLEHLSHVERDLPKLLDRIRDVVFIATTRSRLNLENEALLRLEPLPMPDAGASLDELKANPSAALFVRRSLATLPDFSLNARNAAPLAELCRRLEGNSLMIELAAARVQIYTVTEMLERLDHPLEFLVARVRDRSERHRSVRATLEWSVRLLSPEAQRLLPQLAISRGGWSISVARRVLEAPDLEETLQELIDASLLRSVDAETKRFVMHPIIREYGLTMLDPGLLEWVQDRRLESFDDLAAALQRRGREFPNWIALIDDEVDNVRDCLEWALGHDRHESAARIAVGFTDYWEIRGRFKEGLDWLQACLTTDRLTGISLSRVLMRIGRFHGILSDWESARRFLTRAAAVSEEMGDEMGVVDATSRLALLRIVDRDAAGAEQMLEECLARLARAEVEPPSELLRNFAAVAVEPNRVGVAKDRVARALASARSEEDPFAICGALLLQGVIHIGAGELEQAEALALESLALLESMNHPMGVALSTNSLSAVQYRQHRWRSAEEGFRRVVEISEALGDTRLYAHAKAHLAKVRVMQAEPEDAERLLREADALLTKIVDPGMGANVTTLLAHLLFLGNFREAVQFLRRSVESFKTDRESNEVYEIFVVAAELAHFQGRDEFAVPLMSTAKAHYSDQCGSIDPIYGQVLDRFPVEIAEPLDPIAAYQLVEWAFQNFSSEH